MRIRSMGRRWKGFDHHDRHHHHRGFKRRDGRDGGDGDSLLLHFAKTQPCPPLPTVTALPRGGVEGGKSLQRRKQDALACTDFCATEFK